MKQGSILLITLLAYFTSAARVNEDSLWIRNNYVKKEMTISMRDGVKLFTTVYVPKNKTEKHPILMMRTPYSCAPYGEQYFNNYHTRYINHYFREGYYIVLQDVRGRWMSEGEFVDVRPFNPNKKTNKDIDEASDTYDTIDWLVKNLENNNGNVGVFGISYPGFYSTMAALSGHPALKAVSPQAPVTDWFAGDDFHHNGAFFINDAFAFYSSFGKPRPKPTTVGPTEYPYPTQDNYKFYLEAGSLTNIARLMGDSIKFWKDLYAHPAYDAFWKARNVRNFLTDVKPAMLIVGGTFDAEDCFGAWNTYKAIEGQSKNANNRLVMGPWYHGQWASNDGSYMGNVHFGSNTAAWYQENIEIPFFDFYLKGKGKTPDIKEATVFFTGENNWKQLPAWPPADMQMTPIYLQPKGGLSFSLPAVTESSSTYRSDPAKPVPYTEDVHFNRTISYMNDDQRFAARRPDVLVFQTDTLTEDLTLGGPVIADLVVSSSTTDADFVVKVIDVFPDNFSYGEMQASTAHARYVSSTYPMGGYQMLVRGEVMRGKFRNSLENPVPFKANEPTTVKFTLPDVAHTFQKGHRLMIQIQSSWFPLVDMNPQQFMNIYKAENKDFIKSDINVYHSNKRASKIMLPVISPR
ncbi:CocE/NonD family hydrolase [Chitinophaga sp. SYP-B3965]|uniref:CocE/NonD family hydrolase n=1 Tax=Chitinophaga sp. SYP-B3965 TaxID=2663120 RepID=UPI001299C599|nr:CocE/NonD family hydrolase [Chitinophaga sp. SYP-B3965]MRG45953.1 CocE/NonD family hydrolase [Chitinophaga sp. SYP-B3965]